MRYYTNKNKSVLNNKNLEKMPSLTRINIIQSKKSYSTEYYPWNDNTDYDAVCRGIQKRLQSFKGPPIVHVGTGGGLGHKFVSLLHSFTAALVMKRPLSCMIVLSCDN